MEMIFADGLADVIILNGVVRLDFYFLTPDISAERSPGIQPDLVKRHAFTISMPAESFVSAADILHKVRQGMVPETLEGSDLGTPVNSSPNFKLS